MGSVYQRGRQAPFVQVPFDLIDDPNVDALSLAIYVILKRFADIGSEEGSRVSDARAAKLGQVSTRTLIRRRQQLRDSGWLEWEGKDGRTNRYLVHATTPGPVTESHTPSDSESHPPVTESHTTKIQKTKKQKPKEKKGEFASELAEIFDYWIEKRRSVGLKKAQQTKKRVSKVMARLRDGFTVDDIKQAIDGCFSSEYHRENGYLDMELICRDEGKVEMFMAKVKPIAKEPRREPKADYWRVCPKCEQEKHYKLTWTEYREKQENGWMCDDCAGNGLTKLGDVPFVKIKGMD